MKRYTLPTKPRHSHSNSPRLRHRPRILHLCKDPIKFNSRLLRPSNILYAANPPKARDQTKSFSSVISHQNQELSATSSYKSDTIRHSSKDVRNMASTDKTDAIYSILSKSQPTFDQVDTDWNTLGLSSTPFKFIVSCALSTMTTNPRTIKACVALFDQVDSFEALRDFPEEELVELIRPVAHYNKKAKSLKKMSALIISQFHGQIPRTKKELLSLPGIGQKCSNLVMTYLYNEPIIAVDTHVHRVVNRIGMTHCSTPEKTAQELNAITPDQLKQHAHEWLISLGMNICKPHKPRCEECPVSAYCDYFQNHR